ncbi:hypothetical protein AGMMS4952_12660 [Spirochaetia bacterium]|nr:hypothetical protein AGMMS4952_12660 [Spirochaetia bacterium]
MKQNKVIFAFALFAALGTSANADITFNAWGRGVVTPLAFTFDDAGAHSAVSAATYTSSDTPSIGFTANGVAPSGKIGFKIDLAFGNAEAGIGDNAKVWVKPFEMFTLTAGFFKEEELRGKIGASEFAAWILPNSSKNEDNIFQRFDAFSGAHFKLDPLNWWHSDWNGLTFQGAFGSNAPGSPGNNVRAILNLFNNEDNETAGIYDESRAEYDGDRKVSALDVYKAMQFALGYRIPDVGLVRFQFIGNNRDVFRWSEPNGASTSTITNSEKKLVNGMNTNRDADIIEIAFLYNGLPGLNVDLGVKIPLEYKTETNFIVYPRVMGSDGTVKYEITNPTKKEYTVQQPYVVALGASWTPTFLKSLHLTLRFDGSFGGKIESAGDTKVTSGADINVWLMPSYSITANVTAGFDTGLEFHGLDTLWQSGIAADKAQTEVSQYFDFGIGPWVELQLGGGRIKTGVVMMLPGSARYNYNQSSATYTYSPKFRAEPVFSIPISFTYSF